MGSVGHRFDIAVTTQTQFKRLSVTLPFFFLLICVSKIIHPLHFQHFSGLGLSQKPFNSPSYERQQTEDNWSIQKKKKKKQLHELLMPTLGWSVIFQVLQDVFQAWWSIMWGWGKITTTPWITSRKHAHINTHTHTPISIPQAHQRLWHPLWDKPTGDRGGKQQWFNTLFCRFNDVSSAIKPLTYSCESMQWTRRKSHTQRSIASSVKVYFSSFCFEGRHSSLDFTRQQMSEGVWPYLIPVSHAALIFPQQACQMSGSHVLFLRLQTCQDICGGHNQQAEPQKKRKEFKFCSQLKLQKVSVGICHYY